ncbi:hypothetical protein PV379_19115 [Streptomyces caniscabiei]|nr:hypothetical protein [Streptomyces caniscabiei]MDX2779411.1 hypothetical protein [Streptomyces caniscabiei]
MGSGNPEHAGDGVEKGVRSGTGAGAPRDVSVGADEQAAVVLDAAMGKSYSADARSTAPAHASPRRPVISVNRPGRPGPPWTYDGG